jgi:hypothetical protein
VVIFPSRYRALRDQPPTTPGHLRRWINAFVGIDLARRPVCEGHMAPFDIFIDIYFNEPSVYLMLGPRGGGKSMMTGILSHMRSRFLPRFESRIMGGSREQSRQIYKAIDEFIMSGSGLLDSDRDTILDLQRERAIYRNGSGVAILPASSKAARGPHVPALFLDEVDEIKRDIYDSAIGMAQENRARGHKTMVGQSSTWHNEGGLMGDQIERAKEHGYPFYNFCVFEVLERCPEWRSGPGLEKCPNCPIVQWCHGDIHGYGKGVPKAKRSNGHYSIETLIQKARVLGEGVIQSDYLCMGPRSEGLWFRTFTDDNIAGPALKAAGFGVYRPGEQAYIPVDYGVHTGVVAFQRRGRATPYGMAEDIHVFDEYYSEGMSAYDNGKAIKARFERIMGGRDIGTTRNTVDPASKARDAIGPVGMAELQRGGLRHLAPWPNMSHHKLDSLRLIESFIKSGWGTRHLFIADHCKYTIGAFRQYSRRKVGDVFLSDPADPQHPWEDMIDSLAGGLRDIYPLGREVQGSDRGRVHIASIRG